MNRLRTGLAATGWIVSIGIFISLTLFTILCWAQATQIGKPIRDPQRYEEMLSKYDGGSDVVAHFPPHIPTEATEVEFIYNPAFLQGGSSMSLRYRLPPAEFEALMEQYSQFELDVESAEPRNLPDGFQVVYLHNASSDQWTGYAYGVAVMIEQREVLFWVEDVRT